MDFKKVIDRIDFVVEELETLRLCFENEDKLYLFPSHLSSAYSGIKSIYSLLKEIFN